jgi:hypothetical protein
VVALPLSFAMVLDIYKNSATLRSMKHVKENRNLYLSLIQSWEGELEIYQHSLNVLERDDKLRKTPIVKRMKNRIKRCKWNITRSKNLLDA